MSRIDKALQRWWVRAERARWQYGVLGRTNADGTVTITVPERSDFVYVQMDTGTVTQALNKGAGRVALRAGLPVRVRDDNGNLIVDGENVLLLENDTGSHDNDYGVPAHPITIHNDVTITTPASGQVLRYNGTDWINETLDPDDLDDTSTTNKFTSAAEITKLAGIEALADVTDAGNVGSSIHGATEKVTPVDADTMPLIDSAAANALKKVTWANVKATLKSYFDTLYTAINTTVLKTGDTMTGELAIGRTTDGNLLTFNSYSITEGATTHQTGFRRASSDQATFTMVLLNAANAMMGGGVNGDTFRRIVFTVGGELQIGSGSAARDTNLYRASADHLKTDDALLVAAGSGDEAEVGGVLYQTTTAGSNVSAGLTDLASYSVPGNTLSANGMSLWFEAWGRTNATAAAKTLRVDFGVTTLITTSLTASSANAWHIRGRIIRVGATTQKQFTYITERGPNVATTTPAETLSGALTLAVKGQGGASGDITLDAFIVGWDNNNT